VLISTTTSSAATSFKVCTSSCREEPVGEGGIHDMDISFPVPVANPEDTDVKIQHAVRVRLTPHSENLWSQDQPGVSIREARWSREQKWKHCTPRMGRPTHSREGERHLRTVQSCVILCISHRLFPYGHH
jgi:hypothetical protein